MKKHHVASVTQDTLRQQRLGVAVGEVVAPGGLCTCVSVASVRFDVGLLQQAPLRLALAFEHVHPTLVHRDTPTEISPGVDVTCTRSKVPG